MAKKANSAYDGTLLQIKRTELNVKDNTTTIDAENLKFGELIYLGNSNEKYLAVGDGNTKISDLPVFNSIPRDLAPYEIFYSHTDTDDANRIQLVNESGNQVFSKIWRFTNLNSDNTASVDASSNEVKITAQGDWYQVDSNGEIIEDTEHKISNPTTSTIFPRAQKITVGNMTTNVFPYISLCILPKQRGGQDTLSVKDLQKAFGCVSDVESDDGAIIVYVAKKAVKADCYINVFGQ